MLTYNVFVVNGFVMYPGPLFLPKNGIIMRAQDILDITHQLEEKGMTRAQAETIAQTVAAAVEPLATKEELAAAVEPLATRKDMEALERRIDTDTESLRRKDLNLTTLEERLGKDAADALQRVQSNIDSIPILVFGGLLAIALSVVIGINA